MKTLLKLAVAALVIYACWQAGSVYLRYYQFKDEVQQTALFGAAKSDSELHKVIMDIANRMQVPLAPHASVYDATVNAVGPVKVEFAGVVQST